MAVLKNTEALLQNNFWQTVSKGKYVKCNTIFAKQRCAKAWVVLRQKVLTSKNSSVNIHKLFISFRKLISDSGTMRVIDKSWEINCCLKNHWRSLLQNKKLAYCDPEKKRKDIQCSTIFCKRKCIESWMVIKKKK